MSWPPDPDSLGALTIDVTPVIGGTSGEFLKVGATGKLEQSTISGIGVAIGEAVAGGTAPALLFVGAGNLLDQDPLHFGYNKTTGLFTHNLPGASDGSHLRSTQPNEANTPRWYESLGGATFGGQFDPVYSFGWNFGDGGPVDPAFGAVGWRYEGSFLDGGTLGQEAHLIFLTVTGENVRALSFFGKQAAGGLVGGAMTLDDLTFYDEATDDPWLTFTGEHASAGQPKAKLNLYSLEVKGPNSGVQSFGVQPGTQISVFDNVVLGPATGQTYAPTFFMRGTGGKQYAVESDGGVLQHDATNWQLWFFSNTGGAQSLFFRSGATFGGNGEKATNIVNVTLNPEAAQTVPVLDTSGCPAALAQIKLRITADTPALLPTVYFKVLGSDGQPYYLAGLPAGS